jgi:hypothetical protein
MYKEKVIDKAIVNINQLFLNSTNLDKIKLIKLISTFNNSDTVLKRISDAKDIESIKDYLAEIEFAIFFYSFNFIVEFEPLGKKGPDLMISKEDKSCHVEVTRFRKIYPGPSHTEVQKYGNCKRDTQKALNKIINKFKQLTYHPSILAIWNDDEDLEEIEVNFAVQNLFYLPSGEIPENFQFIIYSSKWKLDNSNIYCFPVQYPLNTLYQNWIGEFTVTSFNDNIINILKNNNV